MLLPGFKSEMSAGSTCILFIYQQGATTLVAKKKKASLYKRGSFYRRVQQSLLKLF